MSFPRAQSRSASLAKAGANGGSVIPSRSSPSSLCFRCFGIHTTLAQDSANAAAITLVSLARSYLLRRLFEAIGTGREEPSRIASGRTYRLCCK